MFRNAFSQVLYPLVMIYINLYFSEYKVKDYNSVSTHFCFHFCKCVFCAVVGGGSFKICKIYLRKLSCYPQIEIKALTVQFAQPCCSLQKHHVMYSIIKILEILKRTHGIHKSTQCFFCIFLFFGFTYTQFYFCPIYFVGQAEFTDQLKPQFSEKLRSLINIGETLGLLSIWCKIYEFRLRYLYKFYPMFSFTDAVMLPRCVYPDYFYHNVNIYKLQNESFQQFMGKRR